MDMVESLTRAAGRPVSLGEIQDHIGYLHSEWLETPESEFVASSKGRIWALSKQFQTDMLELYGDLLANAKLTMEGAFQHPDGRPVIKTKPVEVVAIQKEILGMARQDVLEQEKTGIPQVAPTAPVSEPVRFDLDEEEEEPVIPPERSEL